MRRILLDENVPYPLLRRLQPLHADHVSDLTLTQVPDSEVIRMAEALGFAVLVTCDQNIPYQQNLERSRLGFVICTSNAWPIMKTKVDAIRNAAAVVGSGVVLTVAI